MRVVVMPSQWEETAGLAAIEQMMRGGVVIASDIGGLGEVVSEAGLRYKAMLAREHGEPLSPRDQENGNEQDQRTIDLGNR